MFGLFRKTRASAPTLSVNQCQPVTLKPGETILNGALREGLPFPHSCRVGGCGSCKCRLVSGKVRELTDSSYLLSALELQHHYILACQSVAKTDVVIEANLADAGEPIEARICDILPRTGDLAEVRIRLARPLHFRAGQFAQLKASGTAVPPRCYSFAHAPAPEGNLDLVFLVRAVPGGAMSHWLTDSRHVGAFVSLSQAQGNFYLRDRQAPTVCVAGGSGLAPILSLLEAAADTHAAMTQYPLYLYFGVRRREDLYAIREIDAIRTRWRADFAFLPVLSEEPLGSEWTGARGWLHEAIQPAHCRGASAYLCGPPPMVDALIPRLQVQGVGPEQIFFDRFLDQSTSSIAA